MLKSSPLKHKEGPGSEGHLIMTEAAHAAQHGGNVSEGEEETPTAFDIDEFLNRMDNGEVEEVEDQVQPSVDKTTGFFSDPITSVSDQAVSPQYQGVPIVVGEEREGYVIDPRRGAHWEGEPDENEFQRINGVWTHVDPVTKERTPIDNSPGASEKDKAMISDLRFAATQEDFNIDEPLTWINKDENTLIAKIRQSDKFRGTNVTQTGFRNQKIRIELPDGRRKRKSF